MSVNSVHLCHDCVPEHVAHDKFPTKKVLGYIEEAIFRDAILILDSWIYGNFIRLFTVHSGIVYYRSLPYTRGMKRRGVLGLLAGGTGVGVAYLESTSDSNSWWSSLTGVRFTRAALSVSKEKSVLLCNFASYPASCMHFLL